MEPDPLRGPRDALAGLLAVGVAIAVSELAAALLSHGPSVLLSVGALVIRLAPPSVEETVIRIFGFHDKQFLVALMVSICAGCGAVLGPLAARRPWTAWLAFGIFGAGGIMASLLDPLASPVHATVAVLIAAGAGMAALRSMLRVPPHGRRTFLKMALLSVISVALGRWLHARSSVGTPAGVTLPAPATSAPAPPASAEVGVSGMPPLVTRNPSFYRVDTALDPPRVPLQGWRLKVAGMVEHPFELTYEELLKLPMDETYVTLTCVSNEVGGDLVGNARWQGVPLPTLLQRAGPRPEATWVIARSVDGFIVGFPADLARDGRAAMVAVGMNGEALPLEHGFPARLIVTGLYGYISATKWLQTIELGTMQTFTASQSARGLATQGPVKTQSRIDVPANGSRLAPGRHEVAGVAWAQHRGIRAVEIQIDEGPWQSARLADAISADTWRQWAFTWDAASGSHTLRVRATDGTGEVQTAVRRRPAPDGATGHHTIQVTVG